MPSKDPKTILVLARQNRGPIWRAPKGLVIPQDRLACWRCGFIWTVPASGLAIAHGRPMFCRPWCRFQFLTTRLAQFEITGACSFCLVNLSKVSLGRPHNSGCFVALAKRTNWRCGLCGEPIDFELQYPHPLRATLDHIVPRAKGGTRDMTNLRLAHHACNLTKGDADDDEWKALTGLDPTDFVIMR
jgi:hypothetical protein